MLAKDQAVRRLVAACTGFDKAWQAHLAWWEGKPAGEYNDLGALAEWVVDQMADRQLGCFDTLFDEVELLLTGADTELWNLLVIGFLEDIQNAAANGEIDPDIVLPFLGPESRKGWFDLIRWHRPGEEGWPGQKGDS